MKGFALILGFLVLEAAFLWHAAAPLRAARAASSSAPLVLRGAQAPHGSPDGAPGPARWGGGVRSFPTPTFAVEGRRAGFAL